VFRRVDELRSGPSAERAPSSHSRSPTSRFTSDSSPLRHSRRRTRQQHSAFFFTRPASTSCRVSQAQAHLPGPPKGRARNHLAISVAAAVRGQPDAARTHRHRSQRAPRTPCLSARFFANPASAPAMELADKEQVTRKLRALRHETRFFAHPRRHCTNRNPSTHSLLVSRSGLHAAESCSLKNQFRAEPTTSSRP
jgi:hypothetical protein